MPRMHFWTERPDVKRVLVTGARGFIGRCSVPALRALGYEVHAVSAVTLAPLPELEGAHLHRCDLLDATCIDALLAAVKPSHLLHFAWIATPGVYWHSPDNARWLTSSRHLLQRFIDMGGQRVVMAGTCAEYDWRQVGVCDERASPLAPPGIPYVDCKAALCLSLDQLTAHARRSSAWGRIFFQYGAHEHADRLVPAVVRNLLLGCPALCTHGRQVRSFLDVRDVGSAFAHLLDSEVTGPVNIGSAEPVTLGQIVDVIARMVNRRDLVRMGGREAPANEPAVLLPALERLSSEVGWRAAVPLRQGLEDAVAWWRARLRSDRSLSP